MSEEQKLEWYQEIPAVPCKICGCYPVANLRYKKDLTSSIPNPYFIWECCQIWGEEDLIRIPSLRLIIMERKALPVLYQSLAIKELIRTVKSLDAEKCLNR